MANPFDPVSELSAILTEVSQVKNERPSGKQSVATGARCAAHAPVKS
jgi:hypothetical protein